MKKFIAFSFSARGYVCVLNMYNPLLFRIAVSRSPRKNLRSFLKQLVYTSFEDYGRFKEAGRAVKELTKFKL